MKKLIDRIKVYTTIPHYKFDADWDTTLNKLLDSVGWKFVTRDEHTMTFDLSKTNISNYAFIKVWTANFPWGFGEMQSYGYRPNEFRPVPTYSKRRPSRKTMLKLKRRLDFFKVEREDDFDYPHLKKAVCGK